MQTQQEVVLLSELIENEVQVLLHAGNQRNGSFNADEVRASLSRLAEKVLQHSGASSENVVSADEFAMRAHQIFDDAFPGAVITVLRESLKFAVATTANEFGNPKPEINPEEIKDKSGEEFINHVADEAQILLQKGWTNGGHLDDADIRETLLRLSSSALAILSRKDSPSDIIERVTQIAEEFLLETKEGRAKDYWIRSLIGAIQHAVQHVSAKDLPISSFFSNSNSAEENEYLKNVPENSLEWVGWIARRIYKQGHITARWNRRAVRQEIRRLNECSGPLKLDSRKRQNYSSELGDQL